jgi:hypothetical protein
LSDLSRKAYTQASAKKPTVDSNRRWYGYNDFPLNVAIILLADPAKELPLRVSVGLVPPILQSHQCRLTGISRMWFLAFGPTLGGGHGLELAT